MLRKNTAHLTVSFYASTWQLDISALFLKEESLPLIPTTNHWYKPYQNQQSPGRHDSSDNSRIFPNLQPTYVTWEEKPTSLQIAFHDFPSTTCHLVSTIPRRQKLNHWARKSNHNALQWQVSRLFLCLYQTPIRILQYCVLWCINRTRSSRSPSWLSPKSFWYHPQPIPSRGKTDSPSYRWKVCLAWSKQTSKSMDKGMPWMPSVQSTNTHPCASWTIYCAKQTIQSHPRRHCWTLAAIWRVFLSAYRY